MAQFIAISAVPSVAGRYSPLSKKMLSLILLLVLFYVIMSRVLYVPESQSSEPVEADKPVNLLKHEIVWNSWEWVTAKKVRRRTLSSWRRR